jgi:hypothetical protein
MSYAATCMYCAQTVVTADIIGAEEAQQLADHLRAKHPAEVVVYGLGDSAKGSSISGS